MASADPQFSSDPEAAPQNSAPQNSAPDNSAPQDSAGAGERFSLPSSSRSPILSREAAPAPAIAPVAPPAVAPPAVAPPAVAPASSPVAVQSASPGAVGGAQVLEREARARLLALRRIEWVALAIMGVLLGGAAWSWRAGSDAVESQREAFYGAPNSLRRGSGPRGRGGPPGGAPSPDMAPRPAQAGDRKAASDAIRNQLEAFKRDDFAAAIALQSQNLRRNFSSTENFRRTILDRYPAFASFKSVRFGRALAAKNGSPLQIEVTLLGRESQTQATYIMVRESGAYRVDGVSPTSPQASEPEDIAPPAPPGETI